MEISAKELRGKPGEIIEQAVRGADVVITMRGKRVARLVPYNKRSAHDADSEDEIFGLWADRDGTESINDHVRSLRKRRTF